MMIAGLVMVVLSAPGCPVYAAMDTAGPVDTLFIITADCTADGRDDSIFCRITGETWKRPFSVACVIISDTKVIYSKAVNDSAADGLFADSENLAWCDGGYLQCKEKWYLDMALKKLVKTVSLDDQRREGLFDTTSEMSLPSVIKEFYRDSLGYSRERAVSEADTFVATLKKKSFSCLVFPLHPVYASYPMLYEPRSKKFITLIGF
ncbi:MAG: hypothetical protein JXA71_15920 [Chitinispirillaceae bacterium]|nr:hypothetical protein [Chitinispirillaceae bacterium]